MATGRKSKYRDLYHKIYFFLWLVSLLVLLEMINKLIKLRTRFCTKIMAEEFPSPNSITLTPSQPELKTSLKKYLIWIASSRRNFWDACLYSKRSCTVLPNFNSKQNPCHKIQDYLLWKIEYHHISKNFAFARGKLLNNTHTTDAPIIFYEKWNIIIFWHLRVADFSDEIN